MTTAETIDIKKIVNENLISLHVKADTKLGVIKELTDLLYQDGDVTDKEAFIDDVLFRESEGVTGIGQGVAIPHGKSSAVANTTIAIGLCDHDVPWESLDDEPVNVVILFAVRDQDANTLHLKLLQKVATLLANDDFIEKMRNVKSKDELLELLS